MTVTDKNIIIKFIDREVSEVYKKFSNIPTEESKLIFDFVKKIKNNGIDYDPYKNYYKTKGLAEVLETEDNLDIIRLYIFLENQKIATDLEETREFYRQLESRGYTRIGSHLFYYDYAEQDLERLAEEVLAEDLEDADRAVEIFSDEELAYLWIFQTSKEEASSQYIRDNGWEDALGISNKEKCYVDSHNVQVYYAIDESGGIFE